MPQAICVQQTQCRPDALRPGGFTSVGDAGQTGLARPREGSLEQFRREVGLGTTKPQRHYTFPLLSGSQRDIEHPVLCIGDISADVEYPAPVHAKLVTGLYPSLVQPGHNPVEQARHVAGHGS